MILVQNIIQFSESSDHWFHLINWLLHVTISCLVSTLYGRNVTFNIPPVKQYKYVSSLVISMIKGHISTLEFIEHREKPHVNMGWRLSLKKSP